MNSVMFGFSLVLGELLCHRLQSNNFPIISKRFPFNCYHGYAYALHIYSVGKHFNLALST
jgi:hypothetical protein